MTDRDLFYCTDFGCDGHARSNEHCDTVFGGDPDEPIHTLPPEFVSRDRYTVSGNHMRIWRLDAEGNPVGEAIEMPAKVVSFDIDPETDDVFIGHSLKEVTVEMNIAGVDPKVIALLTGDSFAPFEVWYKRQPWYKRWLWLVLDWWHEMRGGGSW